MSFLFSTSSIKRLLVGVSIVLFALVGAYIVYGTKAYQFQPSPPDFFSFFEDVVEDGVNGVIPPGGLTAGNDVGLETRATFTIPEGQTQQIVVLATADQSRVQYLRYDCGVGVCSNSGWSGDSGPVYGGVPMGTFVSRNAIVCIDLPPGQYNNQNLVTFRYKARVDLSGSSNPSAAPDGWFAVRGAATDGSCDSNRNGNGLMFGSYTGSEGGCGGSGFTVLCSGGVSDGNETTQGSNPGGGGSSTQGSNGAGQGNGGGGAGSIADNLSDDPDTIPSSSAQGDTDQLDLDPSPFFDGKEFGRGSESDSLSKVARSTGKKLVKFWYVTVGALILGGGVGYWYWRRTHTR